MNNQIESMLNKNIRLSESKKVKKKKSTGKNLKEGYPGTSKDTATQLLKRLNLYTQTIEDALENFLVNAQRAMWFIQKAKRNGEFTSEAEYEKALDAFRSNISKYIRLMKELQDRSDEYSIGYINSVLEAFYKSAMPMDEFEHRFKVWN